MRPAPKGGDRNNWTPENATPRTAATGRAFFGSQPVKSIIPNPRFGDGIPDAQFIREKVPIGEVASALGLEVFDTGMIRCWHPERHHRGDRTPSVGIDRHYNKVKCFGIACDGGLMGPIDLVIDVQECGLKEAIRWIAQRFEVPSIPKGKQLVKPKGHVARYGYERAIELLLRSGLWAKMSRPAQLLAVTFVGLKVEGQRDESWELEISYRGLAQYSGSAQDQQEPRAGPRDGDLHSDPFSDAVRELAGTRAKLCHAVRAWSRISPVEHL